MGEKKYQSGGRINCQSCGEIKVTKLGGGNEVSKWGEKNYQSGGRINCQSWGDIKVTKLGGGNEVSKWGENNYQSGGRIKFKLEPLKLTPPFFNFKPFKVSLNLRKLFCTKKIFKIK